MKILKNTLLFISFFIVLFLFTPLQAKANDIDVYKDYITGKQSYINKWQDEYKEQMDVIYGENNYPALTEEHIMSIINEFRSLSMDLERAADTLDLDSIGKSEYKNSILVAFQNACKRDDFVFSLIDMYSSHFNSHKYTYI